MTRRLGSSRRTPQRENDPRGYGGLGISQATLDLCHAWMDPGSGCSPTGRVVACGGALPTLSSGMSACRIASRHYRSPDSASLAGGLRPVAVMLKEREWWRVPGERFRRPSMKVCGSAVGRIR
jgi:hypothetical protein